MTESFEHLTNSPRLRQKCDGAQPICVQCSGKRIKCVYRLPTRRTDSRVGTPQDSRESSITGSRREEHNSESEDGTMGSQRARPLSRAHSWDRSSRSGSVSEGHQSPEDEGESKKKVDWYDAQWTAESGLKDTGGAATGDCGPQRAEEAETPSCMSSLIYLAHVRVRVTEPPHSAPQKPTVLRRPRPTPLTILPRQVYPRDSIQGVPTNTTVKPNVVRATEKASQEPINLSVTGELDLPLTNLDLTGVHQVLSYSQSDKSDEFLQELY